MCIWLVQWKLISTFRYHTQLEAVSVICGHLFGAQSLSLTSVSFRMTAHTDLSSAFFLPLLTPIDFRPFSVQSNHLNFGLPAFLLPSGSPEILSWRSYHQGFLPRVQPILVYLLTLSILFYNAFLQWFFAALKKEWSYASASPMCLLGLNRDSFTRNINLYFIMVPKLLVICFVIFISFVSK